MLAATLTGLIKQYAFRPDDGVDPSLANNAIITDSVTVVILIGILFQGIIGRKTHSFNPHKHAHTSLDVYAGQLAVHDICDLPSSVCQVNNHWTASCQ